MKILLAIPSNPRRKISSTDGMPLGVLYLASMIRDNHDVRIADAYSFPEAVDILKEIDDFKPDLIGISIPFQYVEHSAKQLVQNIKEKFPHLRVVIGGLQATLNSKFKEDFRKCDYLIRGESEFIFKELVNCLDSGAG